MEKGKELYDLCEKIVEVLKDNKSGEAQQCRIRLEEAYEWGRKALARE